MAALAARERVDGPVCVECIERTHPLACAAERDCEPLHDYTPVAYHLCLEARLCAIFLRAGT